MMGYNRFVYALFAVSVAVLSWLGYTYVNQNKAQLKYTTDVEHTYQVIIISKYCENLLLDAETKQRGFLLTSGDFHFRESSNASASKVDSALLLLKQIIGDNSRQRVNIHLLETAIKQRLTLLEQNFTLPRSQEERVRRLTMGQLLMNKIHLYIKTIEDEENSLLDQRAAAKDHYQALNFTFVKYAFLFACLFFGIGVLLIIRELRKRVKAQKLLEKSIHELKRSHEEVEQITFAASHDLQEPLRKIRTLSTLFTKKFQGSVDDEGKDILSRIDKASEKMHLLINDLVDFSGLLNKKEEKKMVNLDAIFKEAFSKSAKSDTIKLNMYGSLPYIKGYEPQIEILFMQLLDNAVKFKNPLRQLVINVTYRMTAEGSIRDKFKDKRTPRYHQVTITDNGLGFDNEFREKIFVLFQRLHNQEDYPGKGTGLALVKRIMTNHYGHIEAHGEKGSGATFSMYFPVD
ncbi:MAG: CHASE3 domain-containing protein [Bacteroidota bacterium]